MRCDVAREAVSAVLDGEDPGPDLPDLPEVLRHQAGCPDCADWARTWRQAGARARLATVESVPDLTDRIVTAVAGDRVTTRRRHLPTRLALVAVAVAQLAATTPYLVFGRDQAAPEHLARELGSFGVALSLGLLVAAAWPSLAAGSLPVLAAAGGLLAVTAGLDIVAGRAAAVSELPHLLPAVGVLLLCRLVLTWTPPDPDRPPTLRTTSRTSVAAALPRRGARAGLRLVHSVAQRVRRTAPSRLGRRLAAATVLAAGLAVAAAVPASAHATLQSSNPQAGSIVAVAPSTLSLAFDEQVSVLPGSIKVVDPNGRRVDQGQVTHPGGKGAEVAVDLRGNLPRGSYLVAYRVVSADSHPISGAFTFSVGATSPTASAASLQTTSSSPVGWLLGAGRFLTYLGLTLLLGGAVFLLVCWPAGTQLAVARGATFVGWAVVFVGTLVELGGKGAYDAGQGLSSFGRLSLIDEVVATPYGAALRLRLGVLALLVAWWAVRREVGARRQLWLAAGAVLAAGLLYTFARSGHANAGSLRAVAMASDMAHLAAMATWLGGLLLLVLVLLRRSQLADPDTLAATPAAITRFSRIAAASVVVLIVTGSYQAWRQVGSLDAVAATTYGRLLIVKLGLVTAILVAAAASRAWVRRHYQPVQAVHATVDSEAATAEERPTADPRTELSLLRRSVGAEAALAVVVLGVTAALVAVAPARAAYRPSVDDHVRLGPVRMEVSAVPDGDRRMDLHLYATDASGAPTNPPEVTASLDLPDQKLGPLPLVLHLGGSGHWIGTVSVPIRGDWRMKVSARTTDIDIFSTNVTLPVR